AMPEEERTVYLNKLLRRLLKEQGLSDAVLTSGNSLPGNNATDLFASSQSKGEWYFYNNTLKTQGAAQFKQVWGNRPNADNWRRFSSVTQQLTTRPPDSNMPANQSGNPAVPVDNTPDINSLTKDLPLTENQLKASNDSISNALFGLGSVLLNEAEDYLSAIDALEKLRSHYPSYPNMSEVLFNLYYAYLKAGNEVEANKIKQLLVTQYPSSKFATIISTGKAPVTGGKSEEATKAYNDIYNLFIEGRFDEAEAAKKLADSIYQTNYWQPQLLYIEAVYHIRQRDDSIAKNILQTLIGQDPNAPMATKAQTMIDVLNRRAQIEDELSRYQIQRVEDTTTTNPVQPVIQAPPVRKDTIAGKPNLVTNPTKNDSLTNKPIVTSPQIKKDTVVKKPDVIIKPDVTTNPPVKKDTAVNKPVINAPPRPLRKPGEYYFDSTTKHHAAIVLDKVDPLFVTEVRNAYTRFNRERYHQTFPMNVVDLDANRKILLIGDFASAQEALNYMTSARQAAPSEVMPWLKAEKYSFSIIDDENLPLLLEKKDLEQYRKFLVQNLPGKF
ncbi:MAG: tetratricopeptide repeat protein, partial [Flavisolibacter sp.]|nr:tetratricopeptide repeat protein [Flavisolibacter sp.]